MQPADDPFVALASESLADDFSALEQRAVTTAVGSIGSAAPTLARLQGFDLLEQPLIAELATCPGEALAARSTVSLRRAMIGRQVVVLFENGDAHSPIIIGVIEPTTQVEPESPVAPGVHVLADGERHVIAAQREIVLRCGDASITLTRAGKVIIKGNYILSRSTGYNKIKGAAIDIN